MYTWHFLVIWSDAFLVVVVVHPPPPFLLCPVVFLVLAPMSFLVLALMSFSRFALVLFFLVCVFFVLLVLVLVLVLVLFLVFFLFLWWDSAANTAGVTRYRTRHGWISEHLRGTGRQPVVEVLAVGLPVRKWLGGGRGGGRGGVCSIGDIYAISCMAVVV